MLLTPSEHLLWLDSAGGVCWSRRHPFSRWQRSAVAAHTLSAVKSLLQNKRGRLAVTLGSDLAQTLCLPWLSGLSTRDDWQGYVLNFFAEHFGQSADAWRVSWTLPSFGEAALVCGIKAELWEALHGALTALPLRLTQLHALAPNIMRECAARLADNSTLLIVERKAVQWAQRAAKHWVETGTLARNPGQSFDEVHRMLHALGLAPAVSHLVLADPDYVQCPDIVRGKTGRLGMQKC